MKELDRQEEGTRHQETDERGRSRDRICQDKTLVYVLSSCSLFTRTEIEGRQRQTLTKREDEAGWTHLFYELTQRLVSKSGTTATAPAAVCYQRDIAQRGTSLSRESSGYKYLP